MVLPQGTAFVAASTSRGECTAPPDEFQVVACELGTLDPGASVDLEVTARVTAAPGATLATVAAAGADTADPDNSNNLRKAAVTVVE